MATAASRSSAPAAHRAGFSDQLEELPERGIEVAGEIPRWLRGGLVRVTPSQKQFAERSVAHWFDGAAMLHRFGISGGAATYSNRFLDSDYRRQALETGGRSIQGFATDPCRSLFGRVQSLFKPPEIDNTNVNLVRLGDSHLAMTETPVAINFDPETLATTGHDRTCTKHGQGTTAHPHQDPVSGHLLNVTTKMGPRTHYRVLARGDGRHDNARVLARMGTGEPAYMHSFAVTDKHVLLIENPLVVNPARLAAAMTVGAGNFISQFRWKPELGLRVHAFDRADGQASGSWTADACFVFHTINAYEEEDGIVLDVCAHPDPGIISLLELENLQSEVPRRAAPPYAERLTLRPGADRAERRTLSDRIDIELPRIDYGRRNGRPYRYVYGNSMGDAAFIKDIVKLDVETGEHLVWSEPAAWAGEPVFVRSPNGHGEDDGVLLSVVLDADSGRSVLLVLDARDLSELARAHAPHVVPFGFHGQFFSS